MKHLFFLLLAAILCATSSAQSIRTLGYNTTNSQVVASTTNPLTFTNNLTVYGYVRADELGVMGTNGISFDENESAVSTRANLGFLTNLDTFWTATNSSNARTALGLSTNLSSLWIATNSSNARSAVGLGATWLTNTNVTDFRTAVGLGSANAVSFSTVAAQEIYDSVGNKVIDLENFILTVGNFAALEWATNQVQVNVPILFVGTNSAATTRTNLGLGSGITTNRTFVSYNGTNYTTNSVSISNGVITGWTQ